MEARPALTDALTGAELLRWYWLKAELIDLARRVGVPSGGGKQELTARLAAHLDRRPAPAAAVTSRAARQQLTGELTRDSVIPAGQRCTQELRAFFVEHAGRQFRFDGVMRAFLGAGAGRTLGEAVDHWRATRSGPRPEIGEQFELNRFLRRWHAAHPDGGRPAALAAWREYRSMPVDARPDSGR